MTIKQVFKSRSPSMFYAFKNGVKANFIGGKFVTDIDFQVAELQEEIKNGNPGIYIDSDEATIDSEELSPLETIKKKAIEEYVANQLAAVNKNNDKGNYSVDKLAGLVNSTTIAATTADSASIDSNSPTTIAATAKTK